MPSPFLALFALSLALLTSCKQDEDCAMTSTVPGVDPLCLGTLNYYVGESRLFVSGSGGEVVAYLPADLEPGPYGGTSGRPLTAILVTGGEESLANDRLSTVTFARIDATEAEVRIHLEFDEGTIEGPLVVGIEDVRPEDTGA